MRKIKLNLCSLGDPTNPRTWSGTPFNIYSELMKMDCLASAFSSAVRFSGFQRKSLHLLNKLYYANSPRIERGIFNRYLNAQSVKKQTAKSISNITLHTGTLDLPFYKMPQEQKHYLFCDTTWNLWATYCTDMGGYGERLLRDAERLERRAYHQMEHIFPISEYVKNNLVTHYGIDPRKITPVGTGLGVIKPYHGTKNYGNGKILFTAKGRFKDKGGFLVLEAFKIALKNNPNLQLTIVGKNEYHEHITSPNIKVYGFVPIEQLQELFNENSLFIMPAINEPWGLVYLEALACKMPLVGLNRNSFPEISGNGDFGFGLNEVDPVKLAEIITTAFSKPERLAQMGGLGQDYCVRKFSWNKTVTKIMDTIESLER